MDLLSESKRINPEAKPNWEKWKSKNVTDWHLKATFPWVMLGDFLKPMLISLK